VPHHRKGDRPVVADRERELVRQGALAGGEGACGGGDARVVGPGDQPGGLLALEGGRKAGGQAAPGQPKAERSAWLRVVDQHDYPEIDLRVDMHTDTVAELRLLLQEFRRYQSYYLERSRNPQAAVPEETFVAQLQ